MPRASIAERGEPAQPCRPSDGRDDRYQRHFSATPPTTRSWSPRSPTTRSPSSEREAAEALVAACASCAALHADLLALRAATRAMPTPGTAPRLHADPRRCRPAAPGRLASVGRGFRDVARCLQPAARGRADHAGSRGPAGGDRPIRVAGRVGLGGSASAQRDAEAAHASGSTAEIGTDASQRQPGGGRRGGTVRAPVPGWGLRPPRRQSIPARAAIAQRFQGDGVVGQPRERRISPPDRPRAPPARLPPRRDDGGTAGSERVLAQDRRRGSRRLIAPVGRIAPRRARALRHRWTREARRRRLTRRPRPPAPRGTRLHLIRAHRTPDAARRQRAHLPRIFRAPAPDDVEGRARQRRLRLLQHRPARHPGHRIRTTSRSPSTSRARPSATSSTPSTRRPASGCRTTCATSSPRSARWSRRCASRSTSCRATRPTTSSARSSSTPSDAAWTRRS